MAVEHNTGIYEIRNLINGKRYVGSAVDFGNRWRVHAQSLVRGDHHSRALQRAWVLYTPRAFQFNTLLACSKENLLIYEQICIDALKPEYNIAPRAGSQLGYRHAPEAKAKMAAAARRTRNFTGRSHSAESRAKISIAKTGAKASPAHVAKRTAAIRMLGAWPASRRFTLEQIREIRALIAQGATQLSISKAFGVSSSVISEINTRKAYGWVE